MQNSGVEYDIQAMDSAVQIKTDPDKNKVAQKNIEPALGRTETCVNSSPGKFSIIQTNIRVYKIRVDRREDPES